MTYVGRVTGFVGLKFNAEKKPVIPLAAERPRLRSGAEAAVGADGDSTVKVIDVAANPPKIIASINTGGSGGPTSSASTPRTAWCWSATMPTSPPT